MVGNITSLTNNGLRDWLVQRVSAVVLAAYTIFLTLFIVMHPQLDFTAWHQLFLHHGMRVATVLALLSLITHAWIGLWTISTDYLNGLAIRLIFQMTVLFFLLGCLIWAVMILWGL